MNDEESPVAKVHPLYLPLPYQDSAESGRLILRDGTTATIRPARPSDHAALRELFAGLSPESRRRRFFSAGVPPDKLLESFCQSSDPRAHLTLVVTRAQPAGERIIAAATYDARDDKTAEVAFAVADEFQGKGLGTLLLERLALLAVRHGFTRLWAVTGVENRRMMEIFRNSGFDLREKRDDGYVEIDLSAAPTEASVARTELRDRLFTAASLRAFFLPAPSPSSALPVTLRASAIAFSKLSSRTAFRGRSIPSTPAPRRSARSAPIPRCGSCPRRSIWRSSPCPAKRRRPWWTIARRAASRRWS